VELSAVNLKEVRDLEGQVRRSDLFLGGSHAISFL
jgi:hypothetical protein